LVKAVPAFYSVAQWQIEGILFVANFVSNLNFTDDLYGNGQEYQKYYIQLYNETFGGNA
jgi:hypothetical protein